MRTSSATPAAARADALTLIELPLVLPPAVAGIGLLAALGPQGLLGGLLADVGFQSIERRHFEAALALGATKAGVFLRLAVPIARPALLAGLALAWGRALGEFGATLMFAGSFQGITQTVPLAIYDQFASDFPAALALSALLVIVSAALLLTIKLLSPRAQPPM